MKIIGLTGGIATGKSTVSSFLRTLGAAVLDADQTAHTLSRPQEPLWDMYREYFGSRILLPDGTLDRAAIGREVFSRPEVRHQVDSMAHPIIWQEMCSQLGKLEAAGEAWAVLDVPLLFETGWNARMDETWLVYVPQEMQRTRLMIRDSCDWQAAEQRIRAQMDIERKRELADVIIDNSGSQENTRRQVEAAWRNSTE